MGNPLLEIQEYGISLAAVSSIIRHDSGGGKNLPFRETTARNEPFCRYSLLNAISQATHEPPPFAQEERDEEDDEPIIMDQEDAIHIVFGVYRYAGFVIPIASMGPNRCRLAQVENGSSTRGNRALSP